MAHGFGIHGDSLRGIVACSSPMIIVKCGVLRSTHPVVLSCRSQKVAVGDFLYFSNPFPVKQRISNFQQSIGLAKHTYLFISGFLI